MFQEDLALLAEILFLLDFCPRIGILELQNRVTQNDVTLRVNNSNIFIEILLSSY